ncbi:MAG: tetratricopeptide repeat protein [Gemmataceae bacterium]|nr:tetratricopeptide repeat protein [Gemmataceae bacterium]
MALAILVGLAAAGFRGRNWYRAREEWAAIREALAGRDLAAASTHLDRYVGLRPDDPAGWFLAARTARRRGRFAEAERHLDRCEQAGGVTDPTRLERDLLAVQQGRLGEIDGYLRATIGPDHPDVRLVLEALARGYLAADRWAEARQACEMWRGLEPDHPWPWLWSGWISERLGQVEQAGEFYGRAVDLVPDARDARVALARVLVRRRQPAPAADHYERVLARAPDDPEALFGLAACRVDEGRADEAVPLVDRAQARDPAAFAGLALRGRVAMERRDPAGAEGWFRRAVESQPGDPEALHLLVLSLRGQGKDAEAAQLTRRVEDLQRDLRRLGELIRTINPGLEDAAPCHEAGVIALRVGRAREGVNLLHDALRRKGDHRATHAALAGYYREAGPPALADLHQRLAGAP